MKKILYSILSVLLLASCAKLTLDEPAPGESYEIDYGAPSFHAVFGNAEPTKTYLGADDKQYWTADDMVSVFAASTANLRYVYCGETGEKSGVIRKVVSDQKTEAKALEANYALYPYDSQATIDENGTMTLSLPGTQQYYSTGFGPEANTMVAVTSSVDDDDFSFKNTCGYLVVKLYGKISVQSVTLSGNAGEKIAGPAEVSVTYGGNPTVSMLDNASTSVTIECPTAVKLGESSSEATEFCFVLPPVTFSHGFTIQVTDTAGKTFSKTNKRNCAIGRNLLTSTPALGVSTTPGEFVRFISEPELYDKDKIKNMILDYAGDMIPDGIIGTTLINLGTSIIAKNGDIMLNRIVYTTTDRNGNIIEASGIVTYPKSLKTYTKVLGVQHVTWDISDAPTKVELPYEIGTCFKEGNQIVALADYLGYGVSETYDLQHPYMHSELTGTACADIIDAAQDFVQNEVGIKKGSSLSIDLIEYSQGGAATISTLLELEKRGLGSKIGSVYAGGGPYDLDVFLKQFLEHPEQPYSSLEYVCYLIRGLVYGDRLDVDFHNIFAPEVFASGAFDKFSTTQVNSWHGRLGNDVRKVLHPDFFAPDFNANKDIVKIMNSVQKNSLVNYSIQNASKVKLYHSTQDSLIPYQCMTSAKNTWGCKTEDLEKDNHSDAGIEFIVKYVNSSLWSLISSLF